MIEKPGIIIKRLREERGIKAVVFAEKIGMSKEQLSQTESGRSDTLSSDSVYKFANGFNMKPGELAGMLYGSAEATLDSLSEIVKLPVKGFINAGTPTLAEAVELGNAFIRKVDVSGAKKVSGLYCLRISGESLIGDQINNGDDVVIEPFGRRQLLLPVNDNYICRFPSFLFWSFLLSGLRCWAAAVR
jgi:transcriptional regulator with XRE-family HTH domain